MFPLKETLHYARDLMVPLSPGWSSDKHEVLMCSKTKKEAKHSSPPRQMLPTNRIIAQLGLQARTSGLL